MSTQRPLRRIEIDSAAQIPEMIRRIVDAFHPLKIILFGSQARGDAKPDSDVDLLVVFDEIEDKRQKTIDVLGLFSDMIVSVDVFVSTPEEIERRKHSYASIIRPAVAEGKIVYAR